MTVGAVGGILPSMTDSVDSSTFCDPVAGMPEYNATSTLSETERYWDVRDRLVAEVNPILDALKAKAAELNVPFVVWMGVANAPDAHVGLSTGASPTDIGLSMAIRYQGHIALGDAPLDLVQSLVMYHKLTSAAGL